jgi:hypothetical protein
MEKNNSRSEDYTRRGRNGSIKDKIFGKMSEFIGETGTQGKGSSFAIKTIIFGLFALIGFIILVYSIFVAVVGESLASVADTVFVAAIIGSFTLVGIIISQLLSKK